MIGPDSPIACTKHTDTYHRRHMKKTSPTNGLSARTLHSQLRDILLERIESGTWTTGSALPTETDLAKEFGLSAGTVRRALDWLEEARVIIRQQGRGTFVAEGGSRNFSARYERIRSPNGNLVRMTPTPAEIVEACPSAEEAKTLEISAGERIFRISRNQLVDGVVLMKEQIALPVAHFPSMNSASASSYSLAEHARQSRHILGNGHEVVSIVPATEEMAVLFGIAPGTRLLGLERCIRSIHGTPLEVRLAWCSLGQNYYSADLS